MNLPPSVLPLPKNLDEWGECPRPNSRARVSPSIGIPRQKFPVRPESIPHLSLPPVVLPVVAVLAKCFKVRPAQRNVRIVYVFPTQVCFVVNDLRRFDVPNLQAPLAQSAARRQICDPRLFPRCTCIERCCPVLHGVHLPVRAQKSAALSATLCTVDIVSSPSGAVKEAKRKRIGNENRLLVTLLLLFFVRGASGC